MSRLKEHSSNRHDEWTMLVTTVPVNPISPPTPHQTIASPYIPNAKKRGGDHVAVDEGQLNRAGFGVPANPDFLDSGEHDAFCTWSLVRSA